MTNNSLQVFNNGQFSVRWVHDNGEVWFVARDIATALEYKESSVDSINKLMAIVPEIWKGRKRFLTPGGEQEMLCLTENGVYFFLGRSDKPKAQSYQIWIAQDVVPSIRKTGSYSVFKDNPALPGGVLEGAKLIFETAGITDNQLTLALDKVYKSYTGRSALLTGGIQLEAPVKEQALTPTEIAPLIGFSSGKKGAKSVNNMLDNYEAIMFKVVTDRVAIALYDLTDELTAFQVKQDSEKNCMFILDWIDKLDSVTRTAHKSIEGYTARLGYHVVETPELETPENF